jgi:hypothetical protein
MAVFSGIRQTLTVVVDRAENPFKLAWIIKAGILNCNKACDWVAAFGDHDILALRC